MSMKNSALLISLALAGINMGSPFSQPSRNIEVGDKALVFPPEQPKLSKKERKTGTFHIAIIGKRPTIF
jgi:hypothetical protein